MILVHAVRGRISEETPHDLRGVDMLAEHLERRLGSGDRGIEGRREPFGRTPWQEDLRASRRLLEEAGRCLRAAVQEGATPITLASDCSLAIGTFPAVAAAVADASFLWLDAHADYDTPETTAAGFLGCMSLAGACGAWDTELGSVEARRVVHVGARAEPDDFDFAGQEQGREELGAMLAADAAPEEVLSALGEGPVYVHFDPDVLDPAFNPIPYGRPGGISAAALIDLLREVGARRPVVGLEVTAFHSQDDAAFRERVCALLGDAVLALVGSSVRG